MKIITYQNIIDLNIHPNDCYSWTEKMIAEKNFSILPPKISMKPFDGTFCNVMPSMIHSDGFYGGIKVVTRYPNRIPTLDGNILLFSADSGKFLALIDGNWITTMRTGAVAAHSIFQFAKKGFETIGIIGLGNVSRATLLFLAEREKERNFQIKLLKYKKQEESFAKRFSSYPNLHFVYVDSYDEVVKESDVVISGVTYAPNNFCGDDVFDEGVLVVPIHTLGFTNCDLFFDKIYGDDYGHISGFKNFKQFKNFSEVSDVINGKSPGRKNDKERILVYNVGISIHDINFAAKIYQLAQAKHKYSEFNLNGPNEKFWI